MRYQDWDVLLFPAGGTAAGHIPVKEFCTRAFIEPATVSEQDCKYRSNSPSHQHVKTESTMGEAGRTSVPILTTFIPALPRNSPFQVSMHSWSSLSPTGASNDGGDDEANERERDRSDCWQVRVVIDGKVEAVQIFNKATVFPLTLASTLAPHQADGKAQLLKFPRFHQRIMSQSTWRPSDLLGRIRVDLAIGTHDQKCGGFVKKSSIAVFAFQVAPLALLEESGIAWPNPKMQTSPLLGGVNHFMNYAYCPIPPTYMAHRRNSYKGNASTQLPFTNFPAQASSSFFRPDINSGLVYGIRNGTSSRSTSAYSGLTNSIVPPLHNPSMIYPGNSQYLSRQQLSFRLPSDQLQSLINAIQPPRDPHRNAQCATAMPPPPLPSHALSSKNPSATGLQQINNTGPNSKEDPAQKRHDSHYSDVSMHPGCNSFPACTSEDAEGRVIHSPSKYDPATNMPATVVCGRKEGSSPERSRDFFSTILDPTMPVNSAATKVTSTPVASSGFWHPQQPFTPSSPDGASVRKRNRTALQKLDTNDGSPEKKDIGVVKPPPRKISRLAGGGVIKSTNESGLEAFAGNVMNSIEVDDSDDGNEGDVEEGGIVVDS